MTETERMAEYYGIGRPVSFEAVLENPEVLIAEKKDFLTGILKDLGLSASAFNASYEKRIAGHDLQFGDTVISKGSVAAVRALISCVTEGRETVVLEQILSASEEVLHGWNTEGKKGLIRITVETDTSGRPI